MIPELSGAHCFALKRLELLEAPLSVSEHCSTGHAYSDIVTDILVLPMASLVRILSSRLRSVPPRRHFGPLRLSLGIKVITEALEARLLRRRGIDY